MAWRYIDTYRGAANELGVKVLGATTILIDAELSIDAELLFPNFGAPNGTLVVGSDEIVWPHRKRISAAGYSFSIFGLSHGEICSTDGLAEMLAEWGWSGPLEDKPSWLPAWEEYWEARIAQSHREET